MQFLFRGLRPAVFMLLFLSVSLDISAALRSTEDLAGSAMPISHGTLVVAIACPRFIVVVTDSRKTWLDGSLPPQDDSKKLFRVGKKRVLAIAGLASAGIPEVPGLSEEIVRLLEDGIDQFANSDLAELDETYWNDPPHPQLPEELKNNPVIIRHLDDTPYSWWAVVGGPTQRISNIAATYHPRTSWPLENYRLQALLAGFKSNGEANCL